MIYTLTNSEEVNAYRESLLVAAPNVEALSSLVGGWSVLLDGVISEIDGYSSEYKGPNLRALLDWSDSWSDAYFEPEDWSEYASYVMEAKTEVEV